MRWIAILAVATFCGCSSFGTTAVDRCEHDGLVVNPNHPMCGVPVSLRIPTHLELKVIETTYWEKKEIPGGKPTLVPLRTSRATRSVDHELCYTEKIFTVDPVRPGAGLQSFGFSFTSSENGNDADNGKGYLRKVEYKIDDQTIQESANLVSNVLGLVSAFQTSANRAQPNKGTLISTDRTVAYGRFDINSCNFEGDVAAFLDCHVNQVSGNCPTHVDVCDATHCNAAL